MFSIDLNGRKKISVNNNAAFLAIKGEQKPPYILFHGTLARNTTGIFKVGLLEMRRQYVHLTQNIENSNEVAEWNSNGAIIITIFALKAYNAGGDFIKSKMIFGCPMKYHLNFNFVAWN